LNNIIKYILRKIDANTIELYEYYGKFPMKTMRYLW